MDQSTLVTSGQALVRALDDAGFAPRFAMWVHNTEIDAWKLWIVPPRRLTNKHEFYQRIARIISDNRAALGGLDVGDTEMILDSHPAAQGMRKFLKMPGLVSVRFSGNVFDGYYLPDGIVLRSDL
jgi:hypothetical protein